MTLHVWLGPAIVVILLSLAASVVGMTVVPWAGAALLVAGLIALLAYLVLHVHRLSVWANGPRDAPLPAASGAFEALSEGLGRRMSEAREERERLHAALERFRAASQAMPDGLIYLSGHDTIEWLNRKAEQHFGLRNSSDAGLPLSGLVRQAELVSYLETGATAEPLVIPSPRRPGTRLLIQIAAFGRERKLLVSRDVTQIEKLETMRRDFIANVSHELRTPLTVVSGFVETVMDGLDDLERDDILRFLNLALEQSTRMQRLIEDLLALSALETGAPAPTEERVNVCELMRTVHQEATLLSAGRHETTLELDPRDEGDLILGSQKELHSAFANLASNAVRYTPPGGRIVMRWCRTAAGAEFSVEDNGIGIDPKHITRLTERFFRVDRSRSRETGGTGLGLAIVKHIVSRHHAELQIESEPGKGSRFIVAFPAARLVRSRSGSRS
ncbi:MAG TPA: phosphate regulon sensor histidine kinase PhoR [Rhodocyclaceae bacterium]|nr:phosphate regulon sensor histidine kinase PhoR [Rhodocyclaceae bacterium]HRQ46500.1 phosphate regulon sensor histidine kinase PhoR [Rhodocyclaceae bacterium]